MNFVGTRRAFFSVALLDDFDELMAEHCSEPRQILLLGNGIAQDRRLGFINLRRFQGRLQVLFGLSTVCFNGALYFTCFYSVVFRFEVDVNSLSHQAFTARPILIQKQSLIVLLPRNSHFRVLEEMSDLRLREYLLLLFAKNLLLATNTRFVKAGQLFLIGTMALSTLNVPFYHVDSTILVRFFI